MKGFRISLSRSSTYNNIDGRQMLQLGSPKLLIHMGLTYDHRPLFPWVSDTAGIAQENAQLTNFSSCIPVQTVLLGGTSGRLQVTINIRLRPIAVLRHRFVDDSSATNSGRKWVTLSVSRNLLGQRLHCAPLCVGSVDNLPQFSVA